MFQVRYEKSLDYSYLMIEVDSDIDSFEKEMLKQEIPGLLPFRVERHDDKIYYTYRTTQKQSWSEFIQRQEMSKTLLCNLLSEVICHIKHARDYLLEPDHFIVNEAYIYVGDQGKTFWLCYHIGYEKPIRIQLLDLVQAWMKQIDYSNQEVVKFVYELYHLLKTETCTYEQILNMLKEDHKKTDKNLEQIEEIHVDTKGIVAAEDHIVDEIEQLYYPPKTYIKIGAVVLFLVLGTLLILEMELLKNKQGVLNSKKIICYIAVVGIILYIYIRYLFREENRTSRMQSSVSYVSIHDQNQMQQSFHASYDSNRGMNQIQELVERETEVLYSEEPTQLLQSNERLLLNSKQKEEEVIQITSSNVVLGSSTKTADILLNYPTISRNHAKIYRMEDRYYIEDLGSSNGTYVNDTKLIPFERHEIVRQDLIRFAEYTYEVWFELI